MAFLEHAQLTQWLKEMPLRVHQVNGQRVFPLFPGKVLFAVAETGKPYRTVILRANREYTREEIEAAIGGDPLIVNGKATAMIEEN